MRVWCDQKFLELNSEEKLLWLFLLTGPHTTALPGLMRAGFGRMSEDLHWTIQKIRSRFASLAERGMAKIDEDHSVVYLAKALRYNQPANQNAVKAMAKVFDLIPDCDFKHQFWNDLKDLCCEKAARSPEFATIFREQFPEPLYDGLAEPIAQQEEQKHQHEEDQDQSISTSRASDRTNPLNRQYPQPPASLVKLVNQPGDHGPQ